MKKALCILLAAFLLMSLAACGGGSSKSTETQEPESADTAEEAAEAAEETAETEEPVEETAEAAEETAEAPAESGDLPEGELWVDIPEGFEIQVDLDDASKEIARKKLEDSGVDYTEDALPQLYYIHEDGSNINVIKKSFGQDLTEEQVNAIYSELTEEYMLQQYQTIDPDAAIDSFEYITVDGAPGMRMSVSYKMYGIQFHCDQIQAANQSGAFTWTYTDMTGSHGDAFAESIASARFTTEQSVEGVVVAYAATQSAEDGVQEDAQPQGTRIEVTVPDGYEMLTSGATKTYASQEGNYIVCTTMDMGDTEEAVMESTFKDAAREEWGELFDAPVELFEHVTVDGKEGLIFSLRDPDMGLIYYMVGPAKTQNMWALIDSTESNEAVFREMVASAVIKE